MRLAPASSWPLSRLVLVTVLALVAAAASLPAARPWTQPDAEVRALWVTRYSLVSPEAVADMVRSAEAGGFNTLLVQVRGRGDAYYAGGLEPRASELAAHPDFDPLAEVLRQAHAAGLRVHAWLAVNLVSSAYDLPASREHIVYREPEWLMVPRDLAVELKDADPRSPTYVGRIARWTRAHSAAVEGLFLSPVHPGAAQYTADVVRDIVERYAVDGVHLDYVRYPNANFDYSRATLAAFRASVLPDLTEPQRQAADARERLDPAAYTDLYPRRWDAFRRSRLTALVMRLRTVVKAVRPDAALSAAVVPDAAAAASEKLQDWRTWLDQSLIDVLCPMAYTQDAAEFSRQVAAARDLAAGTPVWAGVGAYRLSPAETVRHVNAARRLGASGTILFSYDALVSPPNSAATLTELGRAAFGTGSE
ncbi:MAG: glycoside hydrolase family 10 protein [Vicinamibacterales bacterium]